MVPDQDHLKRYYTIPNFRLGGKYNLDADPDTWRNGGEGGTTLESLGAPGRCRWPTSRSARPSATTRARSSSGLIISAFYSGDSTYMYNTWYAGQPRNAFSGGATVGPGRTFDTNNHYVVFLDAIGLWGESKPSAGLGRKFPQYSY